VVAGLGVYTRMRSLWLLLSVVLLACASKPQPVTQPSNTSARSASEAGSGTKLDLVAIDAPPSGGYFGLEIVIEASGPLFAVHWNGLSEEMEPPISIDSSPAHTIEVLRTELDDDRIATMPVTLILDRRVPWSFVAQICEIAQATRHPQANFAFVSAGGTQKTWITIDLGPGGTQVTQPGNTAWIDAHRRLLAAARARKPVELH
jgi:hypothetical protein